VELPLDPPLLDADPPPEPEPWLAPLPLAELPLLPPPDALPLDVSFPLIEAPPPLAEPEV
jgi:hypothetical protein